MSLLAVRVRISALGEKSYVRYAVSGCFNTGLSFALYAVAVLLGLDYLIANVIAWAISVVVAFLLASQYVFRTPVTYRRFPTFLLSNLFSLIASTAMLTAFVRIFSMNPIFASVVAIPMVVAMNFFALKYVVFR